MIDILLCHTSIITHYELYMVTVLNAKWIELNMQSIILILFGVCRWIVWKPISAKTRYILQWMKSVSHEKRCIFQVKRCIFQLVRCVIYICRPPLRK